MTALPGRNAEDPLAYGLHHSARWLDVHLARGIGVAKLQLQVLYGIVNNLATNADLVECVLEYTTQLRNAPQLLGVDLYTPFNDLLHMPRLPVLALISKRLVDLH